MLKKIDFASQFFSNNRLQLKQALGEMDIIIVTAHGLLQRAADNTFPFRQDSNFWYLTGSNEPDITLVIDGTNEYLIVPGRSASREAFDGVINVKSLTSVSGVHTILDETDGWAELEHRLSSARAIGITQAPPTYIEQYGMYTNPARSRLEARLRALATQSEFVDIRPTLAAMRCLKQPTELEAMQQAIDITIDSLEELTLTAQLAKYAYEYEIETDLGRLFRYKGAAGHAFAPIVASGKRACTLHNVANNGPLQTGELLILDVGAEVNNYAADISRTLIRTKPTPRQQAVFDAVCDVQQYALGLLKPGVVLKDYEKQVETYMGQSLRRLKLIEQPDHEAIRRFYPHSTSHFLGLDVHDVGAYDQPLQAGMVLTCEPGIYIMDESIGIRIEDDVVITAAGNKVLSKKLKKTLY